jgi:MFS family permease
MSETTLTAPAPTRRWVNLAMIGCGLVLLVLLTAALVLADKETFGWLVRPMFLPAMSIGAMVGALLMLVAAWNLPQRTKWQGILLMVWALIALTSPAFGFLFLAPWGVLIVLLPFVVAAFVTLRR